MAGSFGYEAEHYDISMKVGADRLFPAVEADADAIVAATGTSCRDQIVHGTQRHAWHPVELVAQALQPASAGAGPGAERQAARRGRRLRRVGWIGARGARPARGREG